MQSAEVLVVDDDPNIRRLVARLLEKDGYTIHFAGSRQEAHELVQQHSLAAIISDLMLPDGSGLDLMKQVRAVIDDVAFIMITGYGTIENAVEAMKAGASHYVTKPFQPEELRITVARAIENRRLNMELQRLREQKAPQYQFASIIGKSKPMRELFRLARRVANSHSTVLIQGESGTGKELIARALHDASPRRERPFLAIGMSGLPETLLETELFGHVRGAFTGAVHHKKGLFEEAHEGSLLLDEIGDISAALQSKLLRVLQEREFKPVGSNQVKKVDVRVIAATNVVLKEAVAAGNFREDLYYRLAVVTLRLPPLRERPEDIPLLISHFLRHYSRLNGRDTPNVAPEALRELMNYPWPGNVRELENVMERAVIFAEAETILPSHLPPDISSGAASPLPSEQGELPLKESVASAIRILERRAIERALQKAQGNRSAACRILKISRGTLYSKLRQYGL